jgi:hypothetical protein
MSFAYAKGQIALLATTKDAKDGLKAFGEKRRPSWPEKQLPGVGLQSGGLDTSDSADLVIV